MVRDEIKTIDNYEKNGKPYAIKLHFIFLAAPENP